MATESTQMPSARRSNAACLHDYVDSTLAFHGLRPHATDQLVGLLERRVVALELLPRELRQVVERHLRGGP